MANQPETRRLLDLLEQHDTKDLAHAILTALTIAGAAPRWDSEMIDAILAPLVELDPALIDPGSSFGIMWWQKIADEMGIDYRDGDPQ